MTPLLPVQAGGAQAFVADLARGLAGRGHEVRLFAAAGSSVEGVEVVPIPVSESASEALFRPAGPPAAANRALREGFERLFGALREWGPDAVSQHAYDAEAIELAEGLPVLHTLHLPPLSTPVVTAARSSRARFGTVSEASRRDWAGAGVASVLLPNGVPDWPFEDRPVGRVALLAGRISPEKGIEDGIAAAQLAGLQPVVVGADYEPGYRVRLAAVEIRPPLARRALWREMAAAAVTVMPVKWEEPFGLVAAEAQLAGCPVAAYDRGALGEVVRDGQGGQLARPDDVEDLARAIRACLTMDRAAVRAQARRRLLLDRTLDAYEAALR